MDSFGFLWLKKFPSKRYGEVKLYRVQQRNRNRRVALIFGQEIVRFLAFCILQDKTLIEMDWRLIACLKGKQGGIIINLKSTTKKDIPKLKGIILYLYHNRNVLFHIGDGLSFHLFCAFHFIEKAGFIDVIAGFGKSVNYSGKTVLFTKIFPFFVITLNEKVDHRSNHKDKA